MSKENEKAYRVLTPVSYISKDGKGVATEAGDIVTDLPSGSVPWLLEGKHIELVKGKIEPEVVVEDVVEDKE